MVECGILPAAALYYEVLQQEFEVRQMRAPVALAQQFKVDAIHGGSPPAPGLLENDTLDGEITIKYGDTVSAFQVAGPQATAAATHRNGSVLLLEVDGSFKYTPPSGGLDGDDFFKYQLINDAGKSANLVTLSTGAPPVVVDSSFSVSAGVLQVAVPGVLAGAQNGGTITNYGPLGIVQTQIGQPAPTAMGGKVWLNADGSFTYVAASGFSGADSFRFIISNSDGAAGAKVTLNVAVQGNVVAPVAGPSSYSGTTLTGVSRTAPGILGNCQVNGAVIVSYGSSGTETSIGQPVKTGQGRVTVYPDGSFAYYGDGWGLVSGDSFVFVISNPAGSSSATVSLSTSVSTPPPGGTA